MRLVLVRHAARAGRGCPRQHGSTGYRLPATGGTDTHVPHMLHVDVSLTTYIYLAQTQTLHSRFGVLNPNPPGTLAPGFDCLGLAERGCYPLSSYKYCEC
eukprot:scaffold519_cov102-Isochrysis_galbana.AAC.9